jgi:ribosomal protein S18 acetylase RimI-like enzyme
MAEIAIRRATAEDAGAIHAMVVALARETGQEGFITSTIELIRRGGFDEAPAAFEAFLALRGRDVVGLALYFYEFSTWRGRRGVYIQDLYVAADARGAGLGRRLVNAVAARAAKAGAVYLKLSVDAANDQAARFYETLGFGERDDERIFVLEGKGFADAGGG